MPQHNYGLYQLSEIRAAVKTLIQTDEDAAEAPWDNPQIQELVASHENLDLQTRQLVMYHDLFLTEQTTNVFVLFR